MSLHEYQAFIGKRLTSSIFDNKGTLLIAEGTVLHESHIDKLANFNIHIDEVRAAADELPASADPVPSAARERAKRTEKYLYEIELFVRNNGVVPVADVEEKVIPFINETAKKYNLFQVFSELKEQGDFRYKQIIGVAVLATSLGKRLRLDDAELAILTTAAVLYDIGSVKLPSSLINKPGRFEHHEYEIMKQHTLLGYELLKQSDVDPRAARVALQHHEREDGSGYPNGLKGNQIDRLSKIVALADVYMAMISERPHRPAFSFFQVIEEIHRGIIQDRFDSVIGMTFLDTLLGTLVGCDVLLSDGRKGKIILTNANSPTKPLVALDNHDFIDLSKENHIRIKEVLG
ncbi:MULTISPECIES: HD-GYP domain-containing protein [Cohnella]|uniref:HD-GYP domain-containing protein n=1 Tax=Cohnella TaxID=329857 RepID=UPI0009B99032|nr:MULTISPECIES: HD domain-containing phosphohydrolase [Cohnella]MBN2983751.1 HD domain-containing protein [Cohnella algarum]